MLALAGVLLSFSFFFVAWRIYFYPQTKKPFGIISLIDRIAGPDGVAGACVAFGILFALASFFICLRGWGSRESKDPRSR